MSDKAIAYLQLTLAMIIVGSSVVVGKLIVVSVPVFLASGLRFGIASIILVPLLIKLEGIPSLCRKDLFILFLQALTGVFGFSICLLYGLKFTGAAESGIITSTTPAVIGLISFIFLKEKLGRNSILGIVLAVLGIIVISVWGDSLDSRQGFQHILGNSLIFLAVLGEALFTIFGKVVSKRLTPLAISTFVTVFGFLMFLPFSIYEGLSYDFGTMTFGNWVSIFYYAIVVTVVGFFLWYSGVAKVPASTAAVFTGVLPISSLLLSYLILGETISLSHVIGFGLVLSGIILSAKSPAQV